MYNTCDFLISVMTAWGETELSCCDITYKNILISVGENK